jgi:hypothetical protein
MSNKEKLFRFQQLLHPHPHFAVRSLSPPHSGTLSPLPHLHPRPPPSPASTFPPPASSSPSAAIPRPPPSPVIFSTPATASFPDRLHHHVTVAASTMVDATGAKRVGSVEGPVRLDASSVPSGPFLCRLLQLSLRHRRGGNGQIELVGQQIDDGWLRISTEDNESRFPTMAERLPYSVSLLSSFRFPSPCLLPSMVAPSSSA